MRPHTLLTATAALTAAAAAAAAPCHDLQVFMARGHGEDAPGKLSGVAAAVCGAAAPSTCGAQSLAYDAHSDATTLCADQAAGVELLRADLAAYAARCPAAALVVGGWSRGGALVTDLLAGGGGIPLAGDVCAQPATAPMSPTEFPGARVAAVVTFGQLHHDGGAPWNVGNGSARDGQYPRTEAMLENLSLWGDRFRDYCHVDDPLCARGADVAAHSSYFEGDHWTSQVVDFVLSRL